MNELVLPTEQSGVYINETYDLLIKSLGAADNEYESLDGLRSEIIIVSLTNGCFLTKKVGNWLSGDY